MVIPSGSASANFSVTPLNDSLTEGSEAVIVTLNPDASYTVVSPTSDTVTIADNEPEVSIVATDGAAGETAPPSVANDGFFTVTRTGSTTGQLVIFYAVSGSASNGADYASLSVAVTILAGDSSAAIPVTVLNDTLTESDETVSITLLPDASYTLVNPLSDVVTIGDNEPEISVIASDASESGASGAFIISRTGSAFFPLTIYFSVGGTATSGGDYAALATSVTIPAGQSTATLTVTPVGDAVDEADETVTLTILPDVFYTVSDPFVGTVTILDDDTAGVNIAPVGGLVTTEEGGQATINIVLTSQPTANVSFTVASSDISEGTVSTSALTFTPANWNTPQMIVVTGVDDVIDDNDIAFNIVTGASVSADPNYSGLNLPDVGVVNTDDEKGFFGQKISFDLNLDGLIDKVEILGGNIVLVSLKNSDGSFRAMKPVTIALGVESIGADDFNADGRYDLIVSHAGTNDVTLLSGNGKGKFKILGDHGAKLGPSWIAVADLNGDLVADLVTANNKANAVSVSMGLGNGKFAARSDYRDAVIGSNPSAVTVGDFDGDGRLDIAVLQTKSINPAVTGSNIRILRGDGAGHFAFGTFFVASANSIASGDLNGDGKSDLVLLQTTANATSVALSTGDSFAALTPYSTGTSPVELALRDFNGDNKLDMVVVNLVSRDATVRLGNGNGGFGAPTIFGLGLNPVGLAVGDFNDDGKMDFLVADKKGVLRTALGNGDGTFLVV